MAGSKVAGRDAFRTRFSRHLATIGRVAFAHTGGIYVSTTAPERGEGAWIKATDEGDIVLEP